MAFLVFGPLWFVVLVMVIGVVIEIVRRNNNKNKQQQQQKRTTIPLEQYFQQSNSSLVRPPTQPIQQTQQPKQKPLITKIKMHTGSKIAIIIGSIFTFLAIASVGLLVIGLPFLLAGIIYYIHTKKEDSRKLFDYQQQLSPQPAYTKAAAELYNKKQGEPFHTAYQLSGILKTEHQITELKEDNSNYTPKSKMPISLPSHPIDETTKPAYDKLSANKILGNIVTPLTTGNTAKMNNDELLQTLKMRLVKGEISKEEYLELRKSIES